MKTRTVVEGQTNSLNAILLLLILKLDMVWLGLAAIGKSRQ